MRFKVVVLALVALFATSALARAQSQTGRDFRQSHRWVGRASPGRDGHADRPEHVATADRRDQRHGHV